jgi:hypothetical protein
MILKYIKRVFIYRRHNNVFGRTFICVLTLLHVSVSLDHHQADYMEIYIQRLEVKTDSFDNMSYPIRLFFLLCSYYSCWAWLDIFCDFTCAFIKQKIEL